MAIRCSFDSVTANFKFHELINEKNTANQIPTTDTKPNKMNQFSMIQSLITMLPKLVSAPEITFIL
jgi:hypothetical protein